jgi:hypothetical protein
MLLMLVAQEHFSTSIASEAVEVMEDHLLFPGGYLLPLSARGSGVPGMADRPWSRLSADIFYPNLPVLYSLSLRREPPDVLRGSLRARRTLFEGFMLALAEKTGRRPSLAERASDSAMDAAESELSFGKPAFRIALLAALFVERNRFEEGEAARRVIESQLRARGLTAQRLYYIAERALHVFQQVENYSLAWMNPPYFSKKLFHSCLPLLGKCCLSKIRSGSARMPAMDATCISPLPKDWILLSRRLRMPRL